MANYEVVEEGIPIAVYQHIRIASGLSAKSDEAAEIGMKNSVHSVMIKENGEIIGMGRIIGDGGCFCQVVDICVLPEHQGRGVGKLIMGSIKNYIKTQLPDTCYVSLIADGDAFFLYEKFGFKDTMPRSKGMFLKVGHQ